MDDIKRRKLVRPQVALPTRRQIDVRTSIAHAALDPATPQNSKRKGLNLLLKFTIPAWVHRIYKKLHIHRAMPFIRLYLPSRRKRPVFTRVGWGALALLIVVSLVIDMSNIRRGELSYELSAKAETLIGRVNPMLAESIKFDTKSRVYRYNEGYKPGGEVAGQVATPKFIASFSKVAEKAATVTDPVTNTSVTFKPQFGLDEPQQDQNRLVYPLKGRDAVKVYSLKSIGMKDDIILNSFQGDELSFKYTLELAEGTEARMEPNGSLAIYGAQKELLGNVSTGSEKDAALLKKARENSPKETLLFTFPAPFIREFNKKTTDTKTWFEFKDGVLALHASGLEKASYPLTIDPSVYIETAAKLMRGNNETNADFDVDNELIQKSQTTGARIDAWEGNLDMNAATWDHGTAAAGGYIYRTGGRTGPAKPQIVSTQQTLDGSAGTTFTMNMPADRPAGDLYIALMCIDQDAERTVTAPAGGGWTEYADVGEHAAYYKIGTDESGGNEASSYQWTGSGSEEWAGVVLRVTGFNSADPLSGTPGTNDSSGTAAFPATTPDSDTTLVVRGVGFDTVDPSDTGWVPSGHTKIDSESSSSGGTGSCGFAAASLDVPPLSSVSTGTASLTGISDEYGGSSIAINPASSSPATQTVVNWAKFNSSTLAIESPNPGTGACSGWCSNSAYALPSARRGHSMVTYNGYLYVMGGLDGSGNPVSTVYIAKLGANGEPQLWHPTDTNPNNWVYWYSDTGLSGGTARAYHATYAYKNKMYILGGDTNTTANSGAVTTVQLADILPNGRLGSWSSGQALPASTGRYGHTVHVYNDVMYLIGGNNNGTMLSSVYYNKLNDTGTMNSWVSTTSFTTARSSHGGNFTTVWGAYIYLSGGCTAVNASGYCTTVASDTQLGSINADGSISEWGSITNLQNQRLGYSFTGWQNGLYRLGGCIQQNTSTGECTVTLADVDYGVINPAGEVSTVSLSVPSGTSPCSGGSPYGCDLPPPGDDAGEGGQMLSMSVIMNGYLYVIGGCIDYDCQGTTPAGDDADVTGNISYVSIDSNGRLTAPTTCSDTSYGTWCVDATNRVNGTTGVAAAGVATFNSRIYIIGGLTGAGISTNIYYNSVNTNGSLAGAWSSVDMTVAGITEDVAYTYAYSRANPSSAGTYPGNLYIFGGCGNNAGGAGCGSSDYETEVYKCNIMTTGAIETADATDCDTAGQLQIDSTPGSGGVDGLGIHSGTIYANYIFLIGGFSQAESDKDDVIYAKFDNSNNVVAASGSSWTESPNKLSVGRRRGFSFGYNGHIYAVGGYDDSGTGIIPFIEWSKMNVSDGSTDPFQTSNVTINQRWGLSMVVSNSYAYVIGGCDVGISPSGCSSFENSIQTFQLYNNDSGATNDFTAQTDQTFVSNTDRWGASSAVLNGFLYVAGGCVSATDCTNATSNVQWAALSASDGSVGSWSDGGATLAGARAWGQLVAAGGTLYYLGGQDDGGTPQSSIFYASTFSGANPTVWSTATGGIGDTAGQAAVGRTKFSAAVWNDRVYVVGGNSSSSSTSVTTTVYISPQLTGGDIAANSWTASTAFNVARNGAAATAYANNLYLFGGFDGTNYLSDAQFTQINSDGTVDSWSYTTSLPGPLRDSQAISANGYIYLIGGRSANSTCAPKTLITPVSANTTIVTGNNPTGIGEWYETNVRYGGGRYGAAVAYDQGKTYVMGGGCTFPAGLAYITGTIGQTGTTVTGSGTAWGDDLIGATITYVDASTATVVGVNSATSLTVSVSKTVTAGATYSISANRHFSGTVKSQPQVAKYSRLIDTDTDVFPNSWLMNGLDNSIGARWTVRYRSMNDTDGVATDCGTADMSTWGQETNFGDVTLGKVETYTPKDGSGNDIGCARYYYFFVSIDASKTFGYPEDVDRGPTINDFSLFFTSDPNKRLRHGKTFTGGEQQPLDTPCRVSGGGTENASCPLP